MSKQCRQYFFLSHFITQKGRQALFQYIIDLKYVKLKKRLHDPDAGVLYGCAKDKRRTYE